MWRREERVADLVERGQDRARVVPARARCARAWPEAGRAVGAVQQVRARFAGVVLVVAVERGPSPGPGVNRHARHLRAGARPGRSGCARSARRSRWRASSSTASSVSRTVSWMRAASAGEAPPSTRPTNVPGSVTMPTLRVWSMAGTRPVLIAWRSVGRERLADPVAEASRASIASASALRPSSRRRPVSVVAVIAPPIRMPAVGIAARGVGSKAPTAIRMPAAPTAGTPIAAIARARAFGTPLMRPPEVSAAVATIAATNAIASASNSNTSAISAPTAASCTVARGGGERELAREAELEPPARARRRRATKAAAACDLEDGLAHAGGSSGAVAGRARRAARGGAWRRRPPRPARGRGWRRSRSGRGGRAR